MRKLSLFLLLLLQQTLLYAQQTASLKGTVMEKQTNAPLPGATIIVKGSSLYTVADQEGNFQLQELKPGRIVLLVSYAGFAATEIPVTLEKGKTTILRQSLEPDEGMGHAVVVSASRRFEKITEAPASIQVIGKKELEEFTGSNTFELLSKVPGVEFTRTGVDHASINARGMNNAFNNKVFQVIDGRNSMAALSGGLPLHNNFSLVKDDIERIEVVLGPQTALYGPNAHNAIINFITKDPRTSSGTTVSLSAGNRYQFSGRIRQATIINSKWAYKFSGEYAVGKDFEFYDSVYAGGGSFGPAVAIPERNINFNFRHIRGEAHVYYRVSNKADIILSGGGSNNNSINTHTGGHLQFRDVTNGFLQARYMSPRFFVNIYNAWGNFGSSFQVGGYTRDFWNRTHTTPPMTPEAAEAFAMRYGNRVKETPQRINAEAQYNHRFEKAGVFLVTGVSYQKDKPRGYGITLVDSFSRIYVTQTGAVLQLEKTLPAGIKLFSALRWDHHSNFGDYYSPKLGIVKQVGEGSLRLTWGKAYSMPSILYQYASTGGFFFGNGEGVTYIPNDTKLSDGVTRKTVPLKPEQVKTWELGYKGTIAKKLFVDITGFHGLSRNFLGPSVTIPGRALTVGNNRITHNPAFAGTVDNNGFLRGARFTTASNFGDVKVYGIDGGLTYSFSKFVSLGIQYSWLGSDIDKGRADNDANKDGLVLADEKSLNSPNHRALLTLGLRNLLKQKLFVTLSARWVETYDFYSGNQIGTRAGKGRRGIVGPYIKNFNWGPLGGFTTVDVSARYKISDMLSAGMNITNLFDTEQREFVGSPLIGRLIMFEFRVHVPQSNPK